MFYRKIINQLVEWKEAPVRKPLVLRGARQTGKSTAVRLFADDYYEHLVEINLEKLKDYKRFGSINALEEFEQSLKVFSGIQKLEQQTLIFIDEIQESPEIIKLLRFVKEERPHWHLIAAGSLLEPILEREGMEFPVGRVSFLDLYPLTFTEFLMAMEERGLVDFMEHLRLNDSFPANFKEVLQAYFYQYLMVGGMPEAVAVWQSTGDIGQVQQLYENLFQGFREDLYKYSTTAQIKYLEHVLMTVPGVAGTNAAYVNIGQNEFKTREIHWACDTLEKIRLLHRVPQTDSTEVPLTGKPKRKHKWLFADVGFCVHQTFNSLDYILRPKEWHEQFRGQMMEQIAGQTLLAAHFTSKTNLFYWAKPRQKGEAEVDFCYQRNESIIGIDIKSSSQKAARALFSFSDAVTNGYPVQSDLEQFGRYEVKFGGQSYPITFVPVYLLEYLDGLLKS